MCKIVQESSNASCRLDPVPTWLLKSCLDVLAPSITEMVNLSLLISHIPENLRTAVVIPLLKIPGLDLVYKKFRPVSNLRFISKVVEKTALQQLLVHCEKNAPLPKFQSGFCIHKLLYYWEANLLLRSISQQISPLKDISLEMSLNRQGQKKSWRSLHCINVFVLRPRIEFTVTV